MLFIKRIRHEITKTKLRIPLYWLRHMGLDSGDVFIASYPRSGSTWLRFLLFEILTGQSAEFDSVNKAIPGVGKGTASHLLPGGGRLFMTHEAFRKEYKRGIYLVRDVRDVVLSEHSYQRGSQIYNKDFEDFLVPFLQGRINGYGCWHNHVNSWLDSALAKNRDLLVIKFEDLRLNTEVNLVHVLEFLGARVDARIIVNVIKNNSLERMREKEERVRNTLFKSFRQDLRFVRQGSVRGWCERLSDDQVQLIEHYAGKALARLNYV